MTSSDIAEFNFIKPGSKEVVVYLEEFIDGSLVDTQTYDLEVENAEIDKAKGIEIKRLTGDKKLTAMNGDYVKLNVDKTPGKSKWELKFTITPEKEYEGDIVLNLEGRGVEDSITLGTVLKNVDMMTGTATSIGLGFQDQDVAGIEITEMEEEHF